MNGPHLALPLLAGAGRGIPDWDIRTWDLSADFYYKNSSPPKLDKISEMVLNQKKEALDELYFNWEDAFQRTIVGNRHGDSFRLLSGYSFSRLNHIRHLRDVMDIIRADGTVFTRYYCENVLPTLMEQHPTVIAVSISSSNQIIPSLELLLLIGKYLPKSFVLLGGNVVTRLRETGALDLFLALSDQLVFYQGETAFRHVLQAVNDVGVVRARQELPKIAGDQLIALDSWPTPSFAGIHFERYCGMPTLPYVSTRGCYWGRCPFCAIPAGWASKGYAGSAAMSFVAEQLQDMVDKTGVARIKFVDESMAPNKVLDACQVFARGNLKMEWEAYARLEPEWERVELLEQAHKYGLRKLYFGLEQAPSASRKLLMKGDMGNPVRILNACHRAGIAVHLFCLVGYPGTSREDAELTTRFLLDNQDLIDTADLVGFRLDRGTNVPGVKPRMENVPDWALALPYEPTKDSVLSSSEVAEIEGISQEALWEEAPQLLHPFYRLVTPWVNARIPGKCEANKSQTARPC